MITELCDDTNNGTAMISGDTASGQLVDRRLDVGTGRHAKGDFGRMRVVDAPGDLEHTLVPLTLAAVREQQNTWPRRRLRGGCGRPQRPNSGYNDNPLHEHTRTNNHDRNPSDAVVLYCGD